MIWKMFGSGPRHLRAVVAILALFVGLGTIHYSSNSSGDLVPSYIACKLIVLHEADHLYAYDPADFALIGGDAVWQRVAAEGRIPGTLHPYVQTPLWAWGLQPLCSRMNFLHFDGVFAVLTLGSFAWILWMVGRRWTPELLNPYAIVLIFLLLYLSVPFRFAMLLMQTHVLFFLMIIGSLLLAERRRPLAAGALLACAAAVKITPGFLVVYWLLGRRWKAAAGMAVCSAAIWGTTLAVCGRALWKAYMTNLQRISATLLVSGHNQSFAAWWMGRWYPASELERLHSFALPAGVKLASTGLMLICLLAGGLVDRRLGEREAADVPLGAMIALVGAMVFSPLAWGHYFVILMVPLMLLAHENRRMRSAWVTALGALVVLLNFSFVGNTAGVMGRFALARGTFYSGILCLGLLGYAAWARARREAEIAAV